MECKNNSKLVLLELIDFCCRKLVNDSLTQHTEEDDLSSDGDFKFLTYNNMNNSILALAAESSGINLEDDLLSTPPRSFDMETSILS